MEKFEFGDVVLASLWRDDGKGKKVRPCLVLEVSCGNQIEVAPLTSVSTSMGGKFLHEVVILDGAEKKEMGLWKDSRLSLIRSDLRVVHTKQVIRKIGKAPYAVMGRCASAFRSAN
jgi:hypothetical protein